MKIAIVHHLNEQKEKIRKIIHKFTDHSVIWTTNYGQHALELSSKQRPDLILFDVEITDLDGIKVTKELMGVTNCPILLITHDIGKNSLLIFEAMAHGALDVAVIPKQGTDKQYTSMIHKITQLSIIVEPLKFKKVAYDGNELEEKSKGFPSIIALGASTGGPLAIASIISSFPEQLEAAVVIVQHVDEKFSNGLVDWLSSRSHLPVQMVESEVRPKSGVIYVSDSKWHLIMSRSGCLSYTSRQGSIPYKPSINVFFESLVKYWPHPGVAVLLTGMGADGAKGLKLLKSKGWYTIAEDEESCAVFGMPKAAIEIDAACDVLKLTNIPLSILSQIRKRKISTIT